MAAWDFKFSIFKKEDLIRFYGFMPNSLDECGWNSSPPLKKISSEDVESYIEENFNGYWSHLGLKEASRIFDSFLIKVNSNIETEVYEANGLKVEVSSDSIKYISVNFNLLIFNFQALERLIKTAKYQDWCFVEPLDGRVIHPSMKTIIEEIELSTAFHFLNQKKINFNEVKEKYL